MAAKRKSVKECCCVADSNCMAPANLINAEARAICFSCGEHVCLACSLIILWPGFGRKRICHNCLSDRNQPHDEERVFEHIYRGAGYPAGAGRRFFRAEVLPGRVTAAAARAQRPSSARQTR
jgi:hypothetical protein